MKLEDVPDEGRIFVDSNTLIYHFSGISPECLSFFERCESGRVEAYSGIHILLEVTHRLMILEALTKGLISSGQPARKLKEKPEIIRSLSDYNRSVRQIPRMGVRIKSLTLDIIKAGEAVRTQEGLMTNDSVTVALMRKMGLTNVATHDSDLIRVSGVTAYQPGDIS